MHNYSTLSLHVDSNVLVCVSECVCVCVCVLAVHAPTGNRTVGETLMNKQSSRSHSLLAITVESRKKENDESVRLATLVSTYYNVLIVSVLT